MDRFRPTWQKIKKLPPELIPLAMVIALGLGGMFICDVGIASNGLAAGFSMGYKLVADPTVHSIQ